jgi:hypothetical protein
MHKFIGLKVLTGLGLMVGAGLVASRMAELRHEMLAEGENGPERHHLGHGHWRRRVPPMFEYWHRQAHAQDQAPAPEADKATPAPESA